MFPVHVVAEIYSASSREVFIHLDIPIDTSGNTCCYSSRDYLHDDPAKGTAFTPLGLQLANALEAAINAEFMYGGWGFSVRPAGTLDMRRVIAVVVRVIRATSGTDVYVRARARDSDQFAQVEWVLNPTEGQLNAEIDRIKPDLERADRLSRIHGLSERLAELMERPDFEERLQMLTDALGLGRV